MSLRRRSWLPSGTLARRTRGPLLGGLWLRVRARWRAAELDRRLAEGADPMLSDELSLRVGMLGSGTSTLRMAARIRRAVEAANGRHPPLLSTRLRRAAVRENEDALLALAVRLRDGRPLGVRGLALAARLMEDHGSPMYRGGASLADAVLEALTWLDDGHLAARG
jgi:hypothetical protein